MPKNLKVILIISSALSIVLLCTTVSFYILKENEKEKKIAIQKSLDETKAAKQSLENRLKDIEITNAELKTSIKSQEEKISMLSQTIEGEKLANKGYLANIQERDSDIEKLKAKIEEEKAEKEALLNQLEKLNENYLNMKFHLENLIKTKEELEKKAKELAEKEGISLGAIVIKQSAE